MPIQFRPPLTPCARLTPFLRAWKAGRMKPKYGFTCSAFDLLHPGHAIMLAECRANCDWLIAGLQSDPTIDRDYRPDKNMPVQTVDERSIMLQAMRWVDQVISYDAESDLVELLATLRARGAIDVRFIGEDWKGKKFTGHELNIPIHWNERGHSFSTTSLRRRIFNAELAKEAARRAA